MLCVIETSDNVAREQSNYGMMVHPCFAEYVAYCCIHVYTLLTYM